MDQTVEAALRDAQIRKRRGLRDEDAYQPDPTQRAAAQPNTKTPDGDPRSTARDHVLAHTVTDKPADEVEGSGSDFVGHGRMVLGQDTDGSDRAPGAEMEAATLAAAQAREPVAREIGDNAATESRFEGAPEDSIVANDKANQRRNAHLESGVSPEQAQRDELAQRDLDELSESTHLTDGGTLGVKRSHLEPSAVIFPRAAAGIVQNRTVGGTTLEHNHLDARDREAASE